MKRGGYKDQDGKRYPVKQVDRENARRKFHPWKRESERSDSHK